MRPRRRRRRRPPLRLRARPRRRADLAAHSVTIAWVGDTVVASKYGMPPDGGRRSMAPVVGPLRGADLAFGNLEETLSALPESKCGSSPNCFAFQAPPSMAKLMPAAGFDIMNLANNHADDFGTAGERSTERALRAAGVRWTGRPGQITILRRNGLRVAFLGFAPYKWASRLEQIGVAKALVRKAVSQADLVVVAMHAGAEGSGATHVPHGTETFLGENRGDSRRFAHAVIDAGADLVVGSGPHVIRGLERYHGRLIAYSLGNFVGYKNFGTGGTLSLSAILSVQLRGDGAFGGGTWTSLRLDGECAAARGLLERQRAARRAVVARRLRRCSARASLRTGRSSCDVPSRQCRLIRSHRGRPRRNRASPSGCRGRRRRRTIPVSRCIQLPMVAARPRDRATRAGASGLCSSSCWSSTTGSPRRCPTSPSGRTSPIPRSSCTRCRPTTSAWSRSPSRRSRASSRARSRSRRRSSPASRPTSRRYRRTTRCSGCSSRRTSRSTPRRRMRAVACWPRSCSASARRC